jgi:hypothetical protein
LANDAPAHFLEADEQELLFDDDGKLKISLYKVMLFSKISEGIRSGALNLRYSYRYRAFDDYLISPEVWESKKDALLEKVGLLEMQDFSKIESQLKKNLQGQFRVTNENLSQGTNKYASIGKSDELKVNTPKQDKKLPEFEKRPRFPEISTRMNWKIQ